MTQCTKITIESIAHFGSIYYRAFTMLLSEHLLHLRRYVQYVAVGGTQMRFHGKWQPVVYQIVRCAVIRTPVYNDRQLERPSSRCLSCYSRVVAQQS